MAKVELGTRRVFTNLKYMYFTPWEDDATLGASTYDLLDIVGDTTSVEQEENEVNEIPHEFKSEPLYETTDLGNKTFTTECVDMQNIVLGSLFGWDVDEAGNAFAPTNYKDLYCKIELGFNSTDDIMVLPKVRLNSRATLASMKTDISRGTISGTCYSAYVDAGAKKGMTDMAVIAAENVDTYSVAAKEPVAGA